MLACHRRVRPLHMQYLSSLNYLNVVAFTELTTHAKSKLSNELEHGGICLQNDVRDIPRLQIINRRECCLTSAGLTQARPNNNLNINGLIPAKSSLFKIFFFESIGFNGRFSARTCVKVKKPKLLLLLYCSYMTL